MECKHWFFLCARVKYPCAASSLMCGHWSGMSNYRDGKFWVTYELDMHGKSSSVTNIAHGIDRCRRSKNNYTWPVGPRSSKWKGIVQCYLTIAKHLVLKINKMYGWALINVRNHWTRLICTWWSSDGVLLIGFSKSGIGHNQKPCKRDQLSRHFLFHNKIETHTVLIVFLFDFLYRIWKY